MEFGINRPGRGERLPSWVVLIGALAGTAAVALGAAGPAAAQTSDAAAAGPSRSVSVGVPDRGRLVRGVALESDDHLISRRSGRWAIAELVGLLRRSSAAVRQTRPSPRLLVGDLSRRRGGHFRPHRSHRSGRDIDIGFFLLDGDGEPVESPGFVSLGADACGTRGEDRYCLDSVRTWELMRALLSDPQGAVQYIFIASDLRDRLIAEGQRLGADPSILERIQTVAASRSGSESHRSHFHLRVYCPPDDRPRCVDEPPYHPWYEGRAAPIPARIRRLRQRQRRAARRRAERRRRVAARRARRARRRRRHAR